MSEAKAGSYLSTETVPLPYCPGCGHTVIVSAIDKALQQIKPDPRKTVIVTDIGCIGLADRNFTTSAFHGLHGRSITYACGLKLARPELTVITLMGDGACGIGGTHLLNAARRNIGISLIVANNFNYGMTGGQHSVTTPSASFTATTPFGNVERPLDLCATAIAAGAPWVYRATAYDKDLPDALARAIRQPGFAMIDIWELCVAYYSPRNDFKKADLLGLLNGQTMRFGQLADDPRAEYSERCRQAYQAAGGALPPRREIEVRHAHRLERQLGVVLAGRAGQKIRSAAALFAQAAIASGLHATQKDDYSITVMTGHSTSEVILGKERIDFTGIDVPDHVVLIAPEGVKQMRARLATLPETSTVYADQALELPATRARVHRLPLAEAAQKTGKTSLGVLALACLLEHQGMFPRAALEGTLAEFLKPELAAASAQAVAAGAALARTIAAS